jgi:hypothetical protein
VTLAHPSTEPRLPSPRGPLSTTVIDLLAERAPHGHLQRIESSLGDADPYGLDLQLALHVCYELHYQGFFGVDPRWEWNAGLLHLRGRMEDAFLSALRRDIEDMGPDASVEDEMARLSVEPTRGTGPSWHLLAEGTWDQLLEYFVHRSIYHLKEGDPHAWAIPRLRGRAKAAFVAVEFDEFGGGSAADVHQVLFGDLLAASGLDAGYLGYLDHGVAESLAVVNLMSMFGLHRAWRGAAVGHFAATEITSPSGSRRMVRALERLGAPAEAVRFYAEHVEADAVHEQVVRTEVVGDLVAREPQLEADVVFGIRAFEFVEDRLGDHMVRCWQDGRTSLRRPLD